MKKFFLLTLLAICSLNVNAEEPRRIYAFLVHNSYYHTAVIKETTTSNNHNWAGFDWKDNLLMGENLDCSNNLLFLFEFTAFNPLEPFCFGGFVVHEEHGCTTNNFF